MIFKRKKQKRQLTIYDLITGNTLFTRLLNMSGLNEDKKQEFILNIVKAYEEIKGNTLIENDKDKQLAEYIIFGNTGGNYETK